MLCYGLYTGTAQSNSKSRSTQQRQHQYSSAVITTATTDKTTFKLLDFPTVDGLWNGFGVRAADHRYGLTVYRRRNMYPIALPHYVVHFEIRFNAHVYGLGYRF